jgi:hypothetical protein
MRIGASSAPYGARCGHGLALFFTAIIPISPEPCDLSGSRPKLGWYHTEPLLGLIGLRWLSAGLPMPTNLTEQIRHCHQRAIECAGKALNAGTAEARNKLLALERDWLALARGYAVDDRFLPAGPSRRKWSKNCRRHSIAFARPSWFQLATRRRNRLQERLSSLRNEDCATARTYFAQLSWNWTCATRGARTPPSPPVACVRHGLLLSHSRCWLLTMFDAD